MELPDPNDAAAVFAYAMSFNAYEKCGSLEAAAAVARQAPRASLDDVRVELFFKARASRHRQDDEYLAVFRELLPLLEKFENEHST